MTLLSLRSQWTLTPAIVPPCRYQSLRATVDTVRGQRLPRPPRIARASRSRRWGAQPGPPITLAGARLFCGHSRRRLHELAPRARSQQHQRSACGLSNAREVDREAALCCDRGGGSPPVQRAATLLGLASLVSTDALWRVWWRAAPWWRFGHGLSGALSADKGEGRAVRGCLSLLALSEEELACVACVARCA